MRRQPTIRGTVREPGWTCIDPGLRVAIDREAARFGVSRSFVIATALEAFFEFRVPMCADAPDYRKLARPRQRKRS